LQLAQEVWIARINRAMTGRVESLAICTESQIETVIARFIRAIQTSFPARAWQNPPAVFAY
jgi:hypothetical protein